MSPSSTLLDEILSVKKGKNGSKGFEMKSDSSRFAAGTVSYASCYTSGAWLVNDSGNTS